MPERTLMDRVEILERKMALLQDLPERVSAVELQIGHLRTEMHEQFSAVRQEFKVEIRTEVEALRTDLRREIREGYEETRRYLLVLHEELLSRIATLQEA